MGSHPPYIATSSETNPCVSIMKIAAYTPFCLALRRRHLGLSFARLGGPNTGDSLSLPPPLATLPHVSLSLP
jgi:hypothetical protein